MPVIQTTVEDLYGRQEEVRNLLAHLIPLRNQGGPTIQYTPGGLTRVLGAHDGSAPISNYRDWRFATSHPDFRANYYEVWAQTDRRHLHLTAAFLTIFQIDRIPQLNEREFLALHAEPETSDQGEGLYKKGPHLHITLAASLVPPAAHIALNRGHLNDVLASVESLTVALEWAIVMIKDEVLDRV